MSKKLIWIVVALLVIGGVWFYAMRGQTTSTNANVAGPGGRCGGNMTTAPVCSTGYHCAPEPGSHLPFGDVGGTCVKS